MVLDVPAPDAAMLLAVKAPPAGAVESECAVKRGAGPVSPALLVAVTEAVPVGEALAKVYAPAAFDHPDPAMAP